MELNGDLSDFALTDILQILALSRKTGTVLLENGSLAGKIVMEEGRITHASLSPGETFVGGLAKKEIAGPAPPPTGAGSRPICRGERRLPGRWRTAGAVS